MPSGGQVKIRFGGKQVHLIETFKVFHLLEPIPLFPGDKKDWDEAGTLCRQGFTTIKRTGMLIVQAVQ